MLVGVWRLNSGNSNKMKIIWQPPLVPGVPPPKLGVTRILRLERLVRNFARLHQRHPLQGTLVHNGVRVTAVALEDGEIESIEATKKPLRLTVA